jgi:hypothetical protein
MPMPEERRGWGTHLLRWLVNFGLLLLVALVFTILGRVITDTGDETLGNATALVVYAWYITTWLFLPGAILYLLILELLPTRLPGRTRRIWALVLSPLVGGLFWYYVVPDSESPAVTIAFVLGAGFAHGAVVRLRPSRA